MVEKGTNTLSVVSYWEVVLKASKGKLIEVVDPRLWWEQALVDFAATPLLLRSNHIAGLCHLPQLHQDPFDRILIAQAIAEDLTLVTTDDVVSAYSAHGLRMVS